MRGGIEIMKKLFLISFLLFIPMAVYSDTLITSSEQLKAEILPLYSFQLKILYGKKVWYSDYCRYKKDIREYFLDGSIPVPFSGEQLLKVCRKNTVGNYDYPHMKDSCRNDCNDFVFEYMKYIAEEAEKEARKEDTGENTLAFDERILDIAYGFSELSAPRLIDTIQDAVIDGELKEPFSVK